MAGKVWLTEEIDFIKNNYINLSPKEMAEKLNRTRKAVWSRMGILGLVKPEPSIGDRFGRLVIRKKYNEHNGKQNKTMALCDCDCGKEYSNVLSQISNGYITGCGCMSGCHNKEEFIKLGKSFTHGLTHTRLYRIWYGMKNRCTNEKSDYQNKYINRGITIHSDWLDFRNFSEWAVSNGYVEGEDCSLERIDVDGNYCPENCKWIEWAKQAHNKSNSNRTIITAFGETKSIYEWVNDDRCNVTVNALSYRIHANWNTERAITQLPERDKKLGFEKWSKKHHPEWLEEYKKFYE